MALPNTTDLDMWNGNKLTNTQWDLNLSKLVQFLTSGTWDMKIDNLECGDITANSIDVATTDGVPTGMVINMATTFAPTGYLRTNGANHLITSYEKLFYAAGHIYGPGDGVSVASSGVTVVGNVCTITAVGHGLANGSYVSVKFTDVASAIVINRGVKIENVSANTFDFAVVGWIEQPVSPLTFTPATTFPVPKSRGYADRDVDTTATIDPDAATRANRGDGTTGAQVGTTQEDNFKEHYHNFRLKTNGSQTSDRHGIAISDTPGSQGAGTVNGQNFIGTSTFADYPDPATVDYPYKGDGTASGTYFTLAEEGENQTNTANIAWYKYIKT